MMIDPNPTGLLEAAPGISLNPEHLPVEALYGERPDNGPAPAIGWELSPRPFFLSPDLFREIQTLGPVLWKFVRASDHLYRESLKGRAPEWVADLLDRGKPESLLQFARMNRLKNSLPLVIRPDLLLTQTGFQICELDSVPGGLGFTSALAEAYRKSGFDVVEAPQSLPQAFLEMLRAQVPHLENPNIAVILSDEAADYRAEMTWLAGKIREVHPNFYLLHPRQVDLVRDDLVFRAETGEDVKIDLIYRFFELFDLPNIPKIDLIQYAVKKGLVHCTPPFKPHLEEKLWLALLHHPMLEDLWRQQMGEEDFEWLKARVPQGWVLDSAPLPPQAVIPGLRPGGRAVQSFEALNNLSQKERELVLKPSGFSPLAWGSRGVTVGHDVSATVWQERLDAALKAFPQTPHILQTFHNTSVQNLERIDLATGKIQPFRGRTRLCPYYLIRDGEPVLSGMLATSCPVDKKVIHGMKDAVLSPCVVR